MSPPGGSTHQAALPVKIAHFGPSGVFSRALSECFDPVGHEFLGLPPGSGSIPRPADILAADIILLWISPQPPRLSMLDDMHAVLVLVQQAEQDGGRPKRIILVSNLLTWGSSSPKMNGISEDDYLMRRCWPCCEGLMALEAHVMRLDGPKLHSCVVAAGAVYGAGEESFFKIMYDAYKFNKCVLPSRGENIIPTVHVGVLCAFLCWLVDQPKQRFPKRYMFACEPKPATVAHIVSKVMEAWNARAFEGAAASSSESSDKHSIPSTDDRELRGEGEPRLRKFYDVQECCDIAFNFPASIMLALDWAELNTTCSIFNRAIGTSRIRQFSSPDGIHHGLAANATEVVEEFVVARRLKPYHIWVLRPSQVKNLDFVARFISQHLGLPYINVESSIKWVANQQKDTDDTASPGKSNCHLEALQLQKELESLFGGPTFDSAAIPAETIAKCVRLRLLDPRVSLQGYVLDAYPTSPSMLRETFANSGYRIPTESACVVANALKPSHVVHLSTSDSIKTAPEFQQWATMESQDWRFGEDTPHTGDTNTIGRSLAELFCNNMQFIPLQLEAVLLEGYEGEKDIVVQSPPHASWKSTLITAFENDLRHGHLNHSTQKKLTSLVHPNIASLAGNAMATLPRVRTEISEEPQSPSVKSTPRHHRRFDILSQTDLHELHDRSSELREFLLRNVMACLANSILKIFHLQHDHDGLAKLADLLANHARSVEKRCGAAAYLQYRSSLAMLVELRQAEADELF